jgi:hypothetical protein
MPQQTSVTSAPCVIRSYINAVELGGGGVVAEYLRHDCIFPLSLWDHTEKLSKIQANKTVQAEFLT